MITRRVRHLHVDVTFARKARRAQPARHQRTAAVKIPAPLAVSMDVVRAFKRTASLSVESLTTELHNLEERAQGELHHLRQDLSEFVGISGSDAHRSSFRRLPSLPSLQISPQRHRETGNSVPSESSSRQLKTDAMVATALQHRMDRALDEHGREKELGRHASGKHAK